MTPWKNFPREMLLLGDDMKEWMEEDGQAEKENIPSSKRMKSDHSKISALDPENVKSLVFFCMITFHSYLFHTKGLTIEHIFTTLYQL